MSAGSLRRCPVCASAPEQHADTQRVRCSNADCILRVGDARFDPDSWEHSSADDSASEEGDARVRGETIEWTRRRPNAPGVYYLRGHYIGHPTLWELKEVFLDADGDLVVSGHAFSPERVYEMDPLKDFNRSFQWFGPLGPMPRTPRELEFFDPRETVRED